MKKDKEAALIIKIPAYTRGYNRNGICFSEKAIRTACKNMVGQEVFGENKEKLGICQKARFSLLTDNISIVMSLDICAKDIFCSKKSIMSFSVFPAETPINEFLEIIERSDKKNDN